MKYKQIGVISGKGNGPAQFTHSLRSITVDRADRLYAAGDSEIKVFDAKNGLIRRISTTKPAFSVAVASNGFIWVGEEDQVEIFDSRGRFANKWIDAEQLGRITAIGFAGECVLLGDAKDRAIRRYDASGKFLNNIGKNNRMMGFLIPNGVVDFSVDSTGVIHVANPGKHRVERYTQDDNLLGYIGRFDGIDPAGFSGCCNPTNVTLTGSDRIYVTEKADPRAKVYDFDGKLLAVIATDVFDLNCKNIDIAVDGRGRVYVTDTVKLQIFAFEGGAV